MKIKTQTQAKLSAVLAAIVITTVGMAASAHAQMGTERAINPGESIQSAIDAAQPGDTIVIRPGVYKEQLLITKDRLTLRGIGVRLEPPATATPNVCDASNKPVPIASGICVAGTFNADGSVADAVENVTLAGISVNGFPGAGISVEAARNLTLRAVETSKNAYIGVFVRFSAGTAVQVSASNDNGDSGIAFIGGNDSKVSLSTSNRNRGEGIVFLETIGGSAIGNSLWGNATGVSVVNIDVLPTTTTDINVRDNVIIQNNNLSVRNQYGQGNPQFQGIGVLIAGASKVDVRNNLIKGHAPIDEVDLPPGGVVIIDTTAQGGAKPADVNVAGNVLRNNAPVDLFYDGTGTNVMFKRNACTSSLPAGLCSDGK